LDQLIDEGMKRKDRQFILITPQTLKMVVPGPHVKVIVLQPPVKEGVTQGQQSIDQFAAPAAGV
jgi:hypothetical protein